MTDLVPIEPEPVVDLGDAKVLPRRYGNTYTAPAQDFHRQHRCTADELMDVVTRAYARKVAQDIEDAILHGNIQRTQSEILRAKPIPRDCRFRE